MTTVNSSLVRNLMNGMERDMNRELADSLADGLHLSIPFADYLAWPILSQSILKQGRASMAHLKAAWDLWLVKKPTDDMILGTALHCAFLDPAAMLKQVALWPAARGRRYGKAWDAFQEEHEGKAILTEDYYAHLIGMMDSLRRRPCVRKWAAKIEATEVSAIGMIDGVRMKGRCDAITTEPLIDLKKVTSTDPAAINRTVLTFGYHIQAAIYRPLFNRDQFQLICIEGEPPYDVVPFDLSPTWLRMGDRTARRLLDGVKACLASGVWPGRSDEVVTLEPPEWAGDTADITIDGTAAFEE